ncbi:MAG TPA: 3-oxoadipate enol-lactonase [Nocardioidaceae bacterium]|nr:3-oxoadipate enol-lactonase [Nocardioidaceae bacterium]
MPTELHHVVSGAEDGPVVLLGPSLGTTLDMWDDLAESLSGRYRVVRFDTRGHGKSPVPAGPYTVTELVRDVLALADSLDVDRFAYVGLSLGGLVGQAIAADHPDRVSALVLACTGPSFGDPATWRERADRVRAEGMGWLVEPTKGRWFTPGFMEEHPDRAQRLLDMIASVAPEGYASCCEAIAQADMSPRLGDIAAPTRVIVGAEDPVTPPSVGQVLVAGIPDADLVVIEGASHIANVAEPAAFDAAVLEHLRRHL